MTWTHFIPLALTVSPVIALGVVCLFSGFGSAIREGLEQ